MYFKVALHEPNTTHESMVKFTQNAVTGKRCSFLNPWCGWCNGWRCEELVVEVVRRVVRVVQYVCKACLALPRLSPKPSLSLSWAKSKVPEMAPWRVPGACPVSVPCIVPGVGSGSAPYP